MNGRMRSKKRRSPWILNWMIAISPVSAFGPVSQQNLGRTPEMGINGRGSSPISRPQIVSSQITTARHMVFDLPDSVVEQSSTQEVLDRIIDECLRTRGRRPIMIQFDPSSKAIWRHWRGTVFAETWKSGVRHALWGFFVYSLFWKHPGLMEIFNGFGSLWAQILGVTTFTLTFFVNRAYSVWERCLTICRTLQGRLNDLGMALAGCAERKDPLTTEGTSAFSPSSRHILQVVARYIRLFNILCYASFARSHRPLVTRQGMRRMVARGLLTKKELQVLIDAQVAPTQRHNAVLMWIFRVVIEGRRAGYLDGGDGFEQQMMAKVQQIRAEANSMESVLKGRMPFAYAHIVQVLVDAVLWMYPFMAFCSGMSFQTGLCGTVLLTTCYQGLFDLAKQFLDPFHNENFWQGDDPLIVDTLIAETNAGSLRWVSSLDEMPIPYQTLKKGNLTEYILPDDGFSIEEAAEREAEKRLQEKTLQDLTKALSPKEFEEKAANILVAAEVELEETKRILSAPPGLDFVPGLNDAGEPLDFSLNNTDSTPVSTVKRDEKSGQLERFLNAAEEELKEAKGAMP